jgi:inner membrane protein YidH
MVPPEGARPGADIRDYLAEERTFLAWIRTGLAVMAFGFVVARFGLFLEQIRIAQGAYAAQPHRFSLWFGTALMAAGVGVNLGATWRHRRVIAELNRGQFGDHGSSREAVTLALFLALVGIAMALYLNVVN